MFDHGMHSFTTSWVLHHGGEKNHSPRWVLRWVWPVDVANVEQAELASPVEWQGAESGETGDWLGWRGGDKTGDCDKQCEDELKHVKTTQNRQSAARKRLYKDVVSLVLTPHLLNPLFFTKAEWGRRCPGVGFAKGFQPMNGMNVSVVLFFHPGHCKTTSLISAGATWDIEGDDDMTL